MQSRQPIRTLGWIAAYAIATGLLVGSARAEPIELKVSHFLRRFEQGIIIFHNFLPFWPLFIL